MKLTRRAPQPPTLQIVQPTDRWVVEGRHHLRVCWARYGEGPVELWEIPGPLVDEWLGGSL